MYTLCNAMYAAYSSFKEEANEEGEYKTSFQDYEDVEGYKSQGVGLQNVKMSYSFSFYNVHCSAYDLVVKLFRECSFWSEIRTILQLEQAKRVSCGKKASPSLTCSRNQDWTKKPRVADRRGRSAKKSPEGEPPDGRAGCTKDTPGVVDRPT